ncbi:phosphopentomutase [Aliiroseovarius sp. PTFE2010]|uniref:phosphopentomutase n=1 Tax=Aliiroseovarius sp. PTFE2010 TaxID=3417190 RepID=UPI003CF84231
MSRAFLIVIDSVGIGGAPDTDKFFNGDVPDSGANTLAHIAIACAKRQAEDGRTGPLRVPNMAALGVGAAIEAASGTQVPDLDADLTGLWAAATEISPGKDTPTGHWELAGVPVPWNWHYFADTQPAFPPALMSACAKLAGTDGTLGNVHASGTKIIADLGEEHIRTGWPICYTSADSVFQIAAHEEHFGLERLLKLCEDMAPIVHAMKVGRVIARPFIGDATSGFTRTTNRHDYAIDPPEPTLLDWAKDAGRATYAVGKIGDIFSMRGIDENRKGDDQALMGHMHDLMAQALDGSLTFANFVEFDSLYGHRRDVAGYARHLEWFDAELGRLIAAARAGDMIVVTADHGNDPTWIGSDHTRERVPVLIHGAGIGGRGIVNFTDVAATVAAHLGIDAHGPGRSFL